MFIYIIVGLAAYILSILLYISYILTFLCIVFLGASDDTTAPTLASPLPPGAVFHLIRYISLTLDFKRCFSH